MVASRDDDDQNDQRVGDSRGADDRRARMSQKSGTDDERVAHMQARHGCEWVVERADQAFVQVDVAA